MTHPPKLEREKVDPEKSKSRINNLLLSVHGPTGAPPHAERDVLLSNSKGIRKESLTGPSVSYPRLSFLLTNAGSVVLGKPRRAFACEATDGVNA